MGTDIHVVVESFGSMSKWWGVIITPDTPRNYPLFNEMASVRDEGRYQPRGLPSNCSTDSFFETHFRVIEEEESKEDTQDIYVEDVGRLRMYGKGVKFRNADFIPNPDFHSHSWLSVEEFEDICNDLRNDVLQSEYLALLSYMKELYKHKDDVRLVFWFDN